VKEVKEVKKVKEVKEMKEMKEVTKVLMALVNRETFDEKKALKLIQLGAYVEVRNNDTQTLLHLTAKNECMHCIEELIKA
jgi:hypothetical protein